MFEYIKIENSSVPKYQQIINSIISAIRDNQLKLNTKIPSLNFMMKEYNLSQDTVLNAYNHLKAQGIITSQVGKGYYVCNTAVQRKHKIFVLFDNYTNYKENLFNAMIDSLGKSGELDLYFHHNKESVFKHLIDSANGLYTAYIIMPTLKKDMDQFIIDTLPVKSVYILDRTSPMLSRKYPFVCQNFETDIYAAFKRNAKSILKYRKVRFFSDSNRIHIRQISKGIQKFTKEQGLDFSNEKITNSLKIEMADIIICLNDRDLVKFVKHARSQNLQMGLDFGIVSYNETDLKQIIGNGITTISTDFELMGKSVINMIVHKERKRIYNKSMFLIRKSI